MAKVFVWEKDLIDLGGSRALIIPSEVLTHWALLGKSTRRVRAILDRERLIIEPLQEKATFQRVSRPKLKLHEAICIVLCLSDGLTAGEIADEIEKRKLYWKWIRGAGAFPSSSQIRARIRKYPELFVKRDGRYHISEEGLKLVKGLVERAAGKIDREIVSDGKRCAKILESVTGSEFGPDEARKIFEKLMSGDRSQEI